MYGICGSGYGKIIVCAETATEFILESVGPVSFKKVLLEFRAFRLIPVICPARRAKPENYCKRDLIPDRAYSAIKSVIFQEQTFSGSAII